MVQFLLGMCESVDEAASLMKTIRIKGVTDPITNSIAPLHWLIGDRSGRCMVIEQTANGLHLFENTIGVLTNSPDFQWQLTNLRNYINLSPTQPDSVLWGNLELTPFGQGGGTSLLPGGYTPPARFARTAFQKSFIPTPINGRDAILTGFHILEGVSIPKGVVITNKGTPDYTQYTAFSNTNTCEYYIKTYENSQVFTVKLSEELSMQSEPVSLGKCSCMIEKHKKISKQE